VETIFEVEMTDLAGNVGLGQSPFLPLIIPMPEDVGIEARGPNVGEIVPSAGSHGGEAEAEPAMATVDGGGTGGLEEVEEKNPFLHQFAIAFRSFNASSTEMSTTEMCERAWNAFLSDEAGLDVQVGSCDRPMTLGETFQASLIGRFVEWFEARCADEYTYYVPTADEWRMAFAGADTDHEARVKLQRWFASYEPGDSRFDPHPVESYSNRFLSRLRARKENRSATGLYDMEANVQEIVRGEDGKWMVVGGYNGLRPSLLESLCQSQRELSDESWLRRLTGFRLARRPR
jgi:hypothetical protein